MWREKEKQKNQRATLRLGIASVSCALFFFVSCLFRRCSQQSLSHKSSILLFFLAGATSVHQAKLVKECKYLLDRDWDVNIRHTYREANQNRVTRSK